MEKNEKERFERLKAGYCIPLTQFFFDARNVAAYEIFQILGRKSIFYVYRKYFYRKEISFTRLFLGEMF